MSSMLEIRHLRLVRAIAEEGGPTRAAARLHLTQSAVSHQLTELEGRLGVPLFARVRRQLKLTPAGARLVDAARTMLGDLSRLETELHAAATRKREALRISVETFTSYHWLPPILAMLAKEAPHVDVRIVLEATRAPLAAPLRGEIDLALVCSPVRDAALVTKPLFADEWSVVVAKSHPLASRVFVSASDLAGETLLVHDAPRGDVERLRDLLSSERAAMPRTVRVPLTDALVDMVRAGTGVGLVSRWAVAPSISRGEIAMRRLTRDGLEERWSAVYRRDAAARLSLERFVELLGDRSLAGARSPSPTKTKTKASARKRSTSKH